MFYAFETHKMLEDCGLIYNTADTLDTIFDYVTLILLFPYHKVIFRNHFLSKQVHLGRRDM